MVRFARAVAVLAFAASSATAATFNTNDVDVYNAFASGATIQTFEAVGGLTPLAITSYTNGVPVPPSAQLGGQITGLHFHSGGANPNDTVGNPGTPVALLSLGGAIAGDARSPTNVVAPLVINTEDLGLTEFLEIVFAQPVSRVGVWLNPALGQALFVAQDASLSALENVTGDAGNFVGVSLATNSIKVVSISTVGNLGFTIDDLTYGRTTAVTVPEPATLVLLAVGLLGLMALRRQQIR